MSNFAAKLVTHLSTPSLVAGARRGLSELFGVAAVSHTRIRTAHLTAGAVVEKLLRWRLPWAQWCYHLRDFAVACAPLSPDGSGAVLWLNRLPTFGQLVLLFWLFAVTHCWDKLAVALRAPWLVTCPLPPLLDTGAVRALRELADQFSLIQLTV
ncbi:hypothetical protein NQZ68_014660 [Dissostichus eleginoides]|nr:hypothetical protein NQZ68_014660 [Dissostichus eleginoides]